jgi:hypothetical protein
MAAFAPLLAQNGWNESAISYASRVAEMGAQVDVKPVDVEGQTVLLCARGGRGRCATIDKTALGVARILATPV